MSDHPQIILAGDIGGTKSNLAILSIEHETLKIHRNHRFPSGDYTSLNAIIHEFLEAEKGHIPAACFGVPGPVKYGRARPTNLNWGVDAAEIEKAFSIPQVSLLNDLEANAYGIGELNPEDVAIIQEGPPAMGGNRCVVSPGTGSGRGRAVLGWCEEKVSCVGVRGRSHRLCTAQRSSRSLCSNI